MTNKRKEIRHAFQKLLEGKTRAAFNVFANRNRPIWEEEAPAIRVWAADEESEVLGVAPRRYRRQLEIKVELYVRTGLELDDEIEDFMEEVENLVDGNDLFSLKDSVDQIIYSGSTIELRGEGSKEGATATLSYLVVYWTWAGVDTSLLPDLQGIDSVISISGDPLDPYNAIDTITFDNT